jgi:transposase-like protein
MSFKRPTPLKLARPESKTSVPKAPSKPPPRTPSPDPRPISVLDIIQGIKDGTVRAATLSVEDRRVCVAHLGVEGLTVPEIAKVLGCSDRTITRDRIALQEASQIEHDPQLAGKMAGRLVNEAQTAIDRMRRVSRERQCPPAVRVEVEWRSFTVLDNLIARLQSLGFLPTGVQRVELESTGDLSIQELEAQVAQLATVAALPAKAPVKESGE